MPTFDSLTSRTAASGLIPGPEVLALVSATAAESIALTRFTAVNMGTATGKLPVTTGLGNAYWVNGDTGLKQTTSFSFDGLTLTAEEIAVVVPVPNAVLADASIDVWAQIRPLLAQRFGRAIDLNAAGHTTPSGLPWSQHRVRQVLRNQSYKGVLVRYPGEPREETKPGDWEPIVTPEQWDAAQKTVVPKPQRARSGRPSSTHLLASLAVCSLCGGTMTVQHDRRPTKNVRLRYQCITSMSGSGACTGKAIHAEPVDRYVIDHAEQFTDAARDWLQHLTAGSADAATGAHDAHDAAKEAVRDAGRAVRRLEQRVAAEADEERQDALLGTLVEARRVLGTARRDEETAAADLARVERTIGGDSLRLAHDGLALALASGPTSLTPKLNLLLREHFAAVIVTPDHRAIPMWKVAVPTAAAPPVNRRAADVIADQLAITLAPYDQGDRSRRVTPTKTAPAESSSAGAEIGSVPGEPGSGRQAGPGSTGPKMQARGRQLAAVKDRCSRRIRRCSR